MSEEAVNQPLSNPDAKSRKNTLFKVIFVLVNIITIAILLIIELEKGSMINFGDAMGVLGGHIIWLFAAIGVFIIKYFADSMSYYVLIKDTTGESRLALSLKVALIGKYGDGITPMATGGQPFQIYFLHKYNIESSKAASISLAKTVVKIIAFDLTMLFFFLVFSQDGSVVVKSTAFFALFINSTFPITILIFSFKRSWGLKLTEGILKLLYKLKIIRNYERVREYWMQKVDETLISIKYFNTHPSLFFAMFGLSVIDIIALSSVPYFVYRAFGGDGSVDWIFMVTSAMYVMSVSIIAPTPGTSGVAEATFYAVFAGVIRTGLMFYAVITWRLITFYSVIIGGAGLMIYEAIYKKKADIDIHDEKRGRITNRMRALLHKKTEAEKEKKHHAGDSVDYNPSDSAGKPHS